MAYLPQTQRMQGSGAAGTVGYQEMLERQRGKYTPPGGAELAFNPSIANLDGRFAQQFGTQGDAAQQRQAQEMSAALAQGAQSQAAQAGQVNQGLSMETRGRQMGNIDALAATARGAGPSPAQEQMRAQNERNLLQQASAMHSVRGGNVGAQQRALADQGAQMQLQTAQQAGALQAQERLNAQQALSQALAAGRGQDLQQADMSQQVNLANAGFGQQTNLQNAQLAQQLGLANAGFQQQANQANQAASLQQQQMNDQMTQYYLNLGFNYEQAQRQAQMDLARLQSEVGLGQMSSSGQRDAAIMNTIAQGAVAAGSIVAGASDKRVKKDIKGGDEQAERLADSLSAYEYEYKDPKKHGQGKYLGVMAQDLERGGFETTDVGGVKMVDHWRGLSAALAMGANQHKRLRKIEAALESRAA